MREIGQERGSKGCFPPEPGSMSAKSAVCVCNLPVTDFFIMEDRTMKKLTAILLCLVLALSLMGCGAKEEPTVTVYVTIANAGELMVECEAVAVPVEEEGAATTIDAVLRAAHEAFYKDGEGYKSEGSDESDMSLLKLWGETDGWFGYYVNNASAWSLYDPVNAGDHVVAFHYKDTVAGTDIYSYFDQTSAEIAAGESLTLTLNSAGWDADWNPLTLPVANADILVNGEASGAVTAADGSATIQLDAAGEYVISAASPEQILVPPVCKVTVK